MKHQKKLGFLRRMANIVFINTRYRMEYNPKGTHWMEEMQARVRAGDFAPEDLLYDTGKEYSKDELRKIFLIASECTHASQKHYPSDDKVFKLERTDIFRNNKSLQSLFDEGVRRMHTSIDPIHAWSHIRRVLSWADLVWQKIPPAQRPDWGLVVIAVVWHDAARVDRLGPADDNFTWLKYIPGGQDLSILYTSWRDAPRSILLFRRAARRHNLAPAMRRILELGISDTANGKLPNITKRTNSDQMLAHIVGVADLLDLGSMGRLEDLFSAPDLQGIVDKKYRDHFVFIAWAIALPVWNRRIKIPEARELQEIIANMSCNYAARFYPYYEEKFSNVLLGD